MSEEFDPQSLAIITYPHPTLRYAAKPIRRVDVELQRIVEQMFSLMYEHRGVGLAATQVNLPLRLFVMNPAGRREEGKEWVVINPVVSRPRSNDEAEEGCLSLPNVHANVIRAKTIHLHAFDLMGREIDEDLSSYEARIVQHETDHLDGTLFIDRLRDNMAHEINDELEALTVDFRSRQRTGEIAADEVLIEQLVRWEERYC